MSENVLNVSVANLVTVTIMAGIGFFLAQALVRMMKG